MKQETIYSYYYALAFQNNVPVSVVLELTTRCNVDCIHCYLPEHKELGLPFNSIKGVVDDLHKLGVAHILLTGGEIFIREDIIEIIRYIRKNRMRVTLLSNGTMLNEKIVEELSKLHIAEYSTTIFSLQEKIHDEITQVDGSLKKLMRNLDLLKNYQIRVKVKMPIIHTNKDCLREVKEYCKKNGFEFYPSTVIFPQNDGNQKPVNLRLKDEELNMLVKEIDKINDFQESPVHQRNVPCAAIFYSFAIDCHGDVFPCNSFLYKIGNIHENSVEDIWLHSEALKELKQIKNSDLKTCSGCNYKKYCERCPGMALIEKGDFLGCDSYAKTVAKIRNRKV